MRYRAGKPSIRLTNAIRPWSAIAGNPGVATATGDGRVVAPVVVGFEVDAGDGALGIGATEVGLPAPDGVGMEVGLEATGPDGRGGAAGEPAQAAARSDRMTAPTARGRANERWSVATRGRAIEWTMSVAPYQRMDRRRLGPGVVTSSVVSTGRHAMLRASARYAYSR
jgi:hypothetical protein